MRRNILTLTVLATLCACANQIPNEGSAICDATRKARADHAKNLAETPDDRVAVTGANLIALLDAGCAK